MAAVRWRYLAFQPLTYQPLTYQPLTCQHLCPPLTCQPLTCQPLTCQPLTCQPLTCQPHQPLHTNIFMPTSHMPTSHIPPLNQPLSYQPPTYLFSHTSSHYTHMFPPPCVTLAFSPRHESRTRPACLPPPRATLPMLSHTCNTRAILFLRYHGAQFGELTTRMGPTDGAAGGAAVPLATGTAHPYGGSNEL